MEKRKIVQYRERLDRTLASPDLTNVDILKKLVKSQLQPLSELEDEGYREKLVEHKTAEVSNFLDMLRSASDDCGKSNTSSLTDWKVKQDNEEFRVMYHEGLERSPFHTLLVEGFVDGPIDVCLCISWQTSLYKKWWPQSTVPTFKILSSECLHKVQIGEQISLVRMKVSWPLSTREAVVHYYLFEYFQDDLIVVLTNSVPGPNLSGFNNVAIPEAKDVVRVDMVGGFALQKVTSERSYFRTIANMDIKLDIVPPSLINFISRQLIGNGFRLYQKAVASMMSHDKDEFSKALGEPLYARIREALYSNSGSKVMNGELQELARILPAEELVERKQSRQKDTSKEDKSNQDTNNVMSMEKNATIAENSKAFGEIVEVGMEETIQTMEDHEKVDGISSVNKGKRSVFIRAEVQEALETLDKAIKMVREYRLHSQMTSFSFANEESPCMKTDGIVDSYPENFINPRRRDEVSDAVPNRDILEGTSEEATWSNSGIQNLRYTRTNPNLTEISSNKIIPTSLEQLLAGTTEASQVALYSLENGAILDQTTCGNKQLNSDSVQDMSSDDKDKSRRKKKFISIVTQDMSTNVPKKLSRQKKYLCCSFMY